MWTRLRLLAVALLAFPLLSRAEPPAQAGLDIYFIDVMGGAATLIVTPEKESILIDSGWPGFDDRDPKRIVHVLKDLAGCEQLDHLVTTHWHVDHYGGVEGLSKRIPVGQYWDRGLPSDGIEDLDFPDGPKDDNPLLLAYLKTTEGNRKVLMPGDALPLRGEGLENIVLASGGHVISCEDRPHNEHCASAPPDKDEDRSDNARSLAFRFTFGAFDFFDGGDLTWNVEKELVCPQDKIGPIDLYQVTHHGLSSSNHPTLLHTIAPTVTVMNNGPRKGGHAEVVHLLRSLPSVEANYQLHKNLDTGPEDNTDPEFIANHDPEGGQFIHVRVEPDGSRFTVRIGPDGEERSFESR